MANAKTTAYKTIGKHLMSELGGLGTIAVMEKDELGEDYELEIPKLQWYDKNRGQIEYFTKELGIPFPAILISFPDTDWEQLGGGMQTGATIVRITTLFENFADSFHGSANQDDALKYFHFNDLVFEALSGYSGSCFSSLVRVKEQEDEDHDFLIITHIDFATILSEAGKTKVLRVTGDVKTKPGISRPAPVPSDSPGDFVLD